MRIRLALPLLLLFFAAPLMAGGEYDSVHIGFQVGLLWSPDKTIGTLGSLPPGYVDTNAEQFAGSMGVQAQYSVIPGKMSIGLLVDDILPINKETGTPTVVGGDVNQNVLRGALRFSFAGRGNMNEGTNFWFSPTFSHIATHNGAYSLSENKAGGGVGFQGRSFSETYQTFYELGIFYVPKLASGTKAGDGTLELKLGWLF